jgi:flagellar hook-associated protein 3 FlgL
MKLSNVSDLARLQTMQRQAFTTRASLDRAGLEMTTGKKASPFEAAGGDLTRLFGLERALERNAVFSDTLSLAEMRLEITQEAFGRVLGPVQTLATDLLSSAGLGDLSAGRIHADAARRAFSGVFAVLNTRVAGQALFAGTATDRDAVAPSETVLAELDALAAGAATASDAITAIEEYFARPAGGFYVTGYLGSTTDLNPVEVGDGQRLDAAVRADADEIVSMLRAHALGAVVAGGAFAGDRDSQLQILRASGERMLQAKDDVLALRARVGASQNAVEQARAGRTAEREALELARAKIVAVDPLEAASTYQTLQVQLESVYMVTSRLSTLRFSNYMR